MRTIKSLFHNQLTYCVIFVAYLAMVYIVPIAANSAPQKRESTLIKRYDSYEKFEAEAYNLIQHKGWKIQHLSSLGDWDDRNDRNLVAVYSKTE